MKTKLRELRNAERLTLKDVSSTLNIRFQALSLYEKGECEPSLDVLCRLADFYGVSIDYILCRDNKEVTPRIYTEDPTLKAILDIYDRLSPVQRGQLRAMAEILASGQKSTRINNI